jgi:adenylate kinase family enzyme
MNSGRRRNHLLIAGTGRAGTSFLVQYLHALGLDTHLSRHADPSWSQSANAGLEDLPLIGADEHLPYVVKSPWLGEIIDQILSQDRFTVDAVVIPVRDLRDAASSRVILELRNIFEQAKWMLSFEETWDEWGQTPGGIMYSLDAIDQERLVAVKFTRLVQALVKRDIRLIFLDFPRIVEDAEYLFRKLKDLLPSSVDAGAAAEAHASVARKESARVSKERASVRSVQASAATPEAMDSGMPRPIDERRELARRELELIALRREIARQKAILGDVSDRALALSQAHARIAELTELLRLSEEQVGEAKTRLQTAQSRVA